MGKRRVYAVSSGSYSDYRVRVLFDKKADAERHAESVRLGGSFDGDARVETFEMFTGGEVPERVFDYRVEVILDEAGNVVRDKEWSSAMWSAGDHDTPPSRPHVKVGQAPAYGKGWYVRSRAGSAEAARKVASDRAAQKRAQLAGVA